MGNPKMSDLEQQASTWVPPWQRPAVPTEEETPAADLASMEEAELRTAAEAAVAAAEADLSDDSLDDPLDDSLDEEPQAVVELLTQAVPEQRIREIDVDALDIDASDLAAPLGASLEAEDEEAEEAEAPLPAPVPLAELPKLHESEIVPALEAILMVVDEPVSEIILAQVLDLTPEQVGEKLVILAESYTRQGRGFDLRRAAGGWRYYTRADYSSYVERFVLDGQQLRLTQASLETLAVVAYKQPVTRSRISAIRGVNVDGVIRTLITRGMVEECGTDPDSGAHLYRTTTLFLEKLGLDSVEQLPPLAPFLPDNLDLEELANGE
ncbi:MAG TPA: SMC-Scp complex subunit ScpB [Micromonosporaceae bacterium]|nr:SMC-Scp complex subunit ScpB [Micromonosporaceae bacterium]HCU48570.1 SMC-Scp complex subunit ScpB [Micromonosporaceae bacterium]